MKWLGFLSRTFSLKGVLQIGVLVAIPVVAGSFWAGTEWQQGRQAQATLDAQGEAKDEADRVTEHQDEQAVEYERDRARREAEAREADRELDAFIDARPGLWDCDIGAVGLRLIRRWDAAGTGGDPAELDDAVPDASAEPEERRASVPAEEPEGSQ